MKLYIVMTVFAAASFLQGCATTGGEPADAPAYQAPPIQNQDYIYRSPSPAALQSLR